MKKILYLTMALLAMATVLSAQSITLSNIGMKSPYSDVAGHNNTPVMPGDAIEVMFQYSTTDFDNLFGFVEGPCATKTRHGYVMLVWYANADGSGAATPGYAPVGGFGNDFGIDYSAGYYNTVTFNLPSPPSGKQSFRVRSMIYGDGGYGETVYSSYALSGTGISGYYGHFSINNNTPPQATGVAISNPTFAKVGQTLNGIYTYYDAESDAESGSTFRWLRAPSAAGPYSAISGAAAQNYTVSTDDLDSYLKFEVTPVSDTEPTTGTPVLSAPSSQVTGAASVEIDNLPVTLNESTANTGALDSGAYITVKTHNCLYTNVVSGVTMTGLPAGLAVDTIERRSATEIRVYISGSATNHEYAASVLAPNSVKVRVPKGMLVGVTPANGDDNLETSNGFNIMFANNAPTYLLVNDLGHDWIQLGWDAPAGLINNSATGLRYYRIYRDNLYLDQVIHNSAKSAFYYTDTSATPGTSYAYKVEAMYLEGENTLSNDVNGTALGIFAFAIVDPPAIGTIDHETNTINLALPSDADLTNLVATFTAPGATVKVDDTTQTSGSTANDFSGLTVVYHLSAADGSLTRYTVQVTKQLAAPALIETGREETTSSFTAKWNSVTDATGYRLDVSADQNFSSYLSSYENRDTGSSTTWVINNIDANTTYYYRVRAIADDPEIMNSVNSATGTVTTLATGSGAGNTVIADGDPTHINMGGFIAGEDTITPHVIVNPAAFSPLADNSIGVSMGLGTSPEGLLYNLFFENPSIGNGSFTISYSGLSYDPTDIRYRLNGGELTTTTFSVNDEDKTFTISISGLSKGAKAAYELQIVTNDALGQTLPVQLSSFTAVVVSSSKVRLDWTTQSESGILGYHILRNTRRDIATAMIVSPMIDATNTSTTTSYSFTDTELPGEGIYFFWLQTTDFESVNLQYGPITVQVGDGGDPSPGIPAVTALNSPYPNPFNPTLAVRYDLAEAADVMIKIYNGRGQLVRTLVDAHQPAKAYTVTWDGKDSGGQNVSTGTYFIRMKAGSYNGFKKAIMLK